MQAAVKQTTQQISVISDPEQVLAAESGELTVGGKPVLITKGGNTEAVCCQIYTRFSKELDSNGKSFVFSRKFKGLAHSDPVWKNRSKVTGPQFELYLSKWFQFAESVSNIHGPALILTDKLPKFLSALMMQTRFTGKFLDLF